jgi:hypothetical protein
MKYLILLLAILITSYSAKAEPEQLSDFQKWWLSHYYHVCYVIEVTPDAPVHAGYSNNAQAIAIFRALKSCGRRCLLSNNYVISCNNPPAYAPPTN